MRRLTTAAILLIGVFLLCSCGSDLPDGEVDISLQDIIEANELEVLLDEYDNILVREDTVEISGFILDTIYHRFALEDGQIVGDVWHEDAEDGMVINARGGAVYAVMGYQRHVTIVPEDDYFARVEKLYHILPDPEKEKIESAVKSEQEILVKTILKTFDDGSVSEGIEYRINAKTLEIESVQVITYNEKGQKAGLVGFIIEYDSDIKPDLTAWKSITQPSDGGFCNVTAVIEPGTDSEEVRKIRVTHECSVEVAGKNDYNIYVDESCHIPLPMVDTMADESVFYAKLTE